MPPYLIVWYNLVIIVQLTYMLSEFYLGFLLRGLLQSLTGWYLSMLLSVLLGLTFSY